MRNIWTRSLCGVAFVLLVNVCQSHAGVVVSNLTATVDGTGTIDNTAGGPTQQYAQEFTTGSQSVYLASIIASLGDATGFFDATAELVGNSGTGPGSAVLTLFTVPTVRPVPVFDDLEFDPTTPNLLLSANTSYWFILSAGTPTNGSYKWQYTNTANPDLPLYAVSDDSGATWTTGTGPFLIQVNSTNATATPEPSSLALALVGAAMVIGRRLLLRRPAKQTIR